MIKASVFFWIQGRGITFEGTQKLVFDPDIVFYFIDKKISENVDAYKILKKRFPKANLFGCTTSGPVLNDDIYPNGFTGMALSFKKTKIRVAQKSCPSQKESFETGKALIEELKGNGLRHVFTITDGMTVNGAWFIDGANSVLPEGVHITGGLASDGFEFKETLLGINQPLKSGQTCAIGFYGDSYQVGFSAKSGWKGFGLERIITKSDHNVLYELDGLPALDLYEEYLGPEAENLPSSGLLFPLEIRETRDSLTSIRTINKVDKKNKALRFTGDVPQGYIVRFMKGNFNHLVEAAGEAATIASSPLKNKNDGVAIIASCLGRQLLMGQHIGDELEVLHAAIGAPIPIVGFYSNGEYASLVRNGPCMLHNETMNVTIIRED